MLLSILVPTLSCRGELFRRLATDLQRQIEQRGIAGEVEVLSLVDDGEQPTGTKRNELLQQARGAFVVFVDDDDEVSPNYVSLICDAIVRRPDADCIGIRGEITFRGRHRREFVHSIRYHDYSSSGGVYTRPPYHLNPMRREIAAAYRFRDVYYSEDIDWAFQIRAARRLRNEEFVNEILYYYRSRRWWPYQWALDRSEGVRHRLGLRMTNRFLLSGTGSVESAKQ